MHSEASTGDEGKVAACEGHSAKADHTSSTSAFWVSLRRAMKASNFPGDTAVGDVSRYANRPIAFTLRFVYQRWVAHAAILAAVLAAVGCSVGTQYGIKLLVDTLTHPNGAHRAWPAFGFLVALIAADSWPASLPTRRSSVLPAICAETCSAT